MAGIQATAATRSAFADRTAPGGGGVFSRGPSSDRRCRRLSMPTFPSSTIQNRRMIEVGEKFRARSLFGILYF